MTFCDNPEFLLSHIQNCFITSDDTGMCELIIVKEEPIGKKLTKSSWSQQIYGSGDDDLQPDGTELVHSYDIGMDMDLGVHRRRSNTAQKLERLKKEKKQQSRIKHIQWKSLPEQLSAEELTVLFDKRPIEKRKSAQSMLSLEMDQSQHLPNNPFNEYAKFDGGTNVGGPTKKINIYLTWLPPQERAYPMTVVTVATARVLDLIGLICWQYTKEGREPPLRGNVEYYSLHIAEDDGEVDMDFPNLDNKEIISKFGFSHLALVQKEESSIERKVVPLVTVNIPQGGFSKIQVESMDIPMRVILEKALKRRKGKSRAKGLGYQLEKQNEPNVAVDLDGSLESMGTLEFCLVRENSTRGEKVPLDVTDSEWINRDIRAMEASLYQSYNVSMFHKMSLRAGSNVHLGISWEKIEIDPVQSKGAVKFWGKQKALSYPTNTIASCELLDCKYSGKSTFRLIYQAGNDFKHYDFEVDSPTAKEIVIKIKLILDMRHSTVRKDYLALKENKNLRKHSTGSLH